MMVLNTKDLEKHNLKIKIEDDGVMVVSNNFPEGTKVKIKSDAIEKGLLKDKCISLIGKEGVVLKKGVASTRDEVQVKFQGDTWDGWIMPINALDIIPEPNMKYFVWEMEDKTKVPKLIWEGDDRDKWLMRVEKLSQEGKTYGFRCEVQK